MTDLYNLTNSGFLNALSNSISSLLSSSSLCDVTLVCDDGQVSAHKLVLAATSSFFSSVFNLNSHPHPLMFLRGVKLSQMKALLAYAYSGGTEVAHKDLAGFLAVAEDLKIEGLIQKGENRAKRERNGDESTSLRKDTPREDKKEVSDKTKRNITDKFFNDINIQYPVIQLFC